MDDDLTLGYDFLNRVEQALTQRLYEGLPLIPTDEPDFSHEYSFRTLIPRGA
jgi:hypothetical protein